MFAAAGRDGRVRVWNYQTGAVVRDIAAHHQRVHALGFSLDGTQLASGGDDRFLRCGIPKLVRSCFPYPAGPARFTRCLYLTPDKLVTGASDNTIRIWDLKSGKEESRLLGHTGSVSSLDYRAETGILISTGFDTSVRLWTPLATEGKVVEENRTRTTR